MSCRPSLPLVLTVVFACTGVGSAHAFDRAYPPPPRASAPKAAASRPASVKLVDLNKASRAELATLPGIGRAEADRIVANRPYMTKTDLVTKKVLPLEAYDALRQRIIVVHKGKPPKPKS